VGLIQRRDCAHDQPSQVRCSAEPNRPPGPIRRLAGRRFSPFESSTAEAVLCGADVAHISSTVTTHERELPKLVMYPLEVVCCAQVLCSFSCSLLQYCAQMCVLIVAFVYCCAQVLCSMLRHCSADLAVLCLLVRFFYCCAQVLRSVMHLLCRARAQVRILPVYFMAREPVQVLQSIAMSALL
jgi:hypothetical protein